MNFAVCYRNFGLYSWLCILTPGETLGIVSECVIGQTDEKRIIELNSQNILPADCRKIYSYI